MDLPPPSPVRQLALGQAHSCALLDDGSVWCWGYSRQWQTGVSQDPVLKPTRVAGIPAVEELAASFTHTFARLADGTVMCWGRDDNNRQTPAGAWMAACGKPPARVPGLTGAVEIDAYQSYACARLADETVSCWGWAPTVLPHDFTEEIAEPLAIDGLTGVREIALGGSRACALRGDGIHCWNSSGPNRLDGTVAVAGVGGAVQIATGDDFSCARSATGEVTCWGDNRFGALGDGTTLSREDASEVRGLSGAVQVTARSSQACAVVGPERAVYCWGGYVAGQAGSLTPVRIAGVDHVAELAQSSSHSCARLEGGAVVCWGANPSGELGDGTTVSRDLPRSVRW